MVPSVELRQTHRKMLHSKISVRFPSTDVKLNEYKNWVVDGPKGGFFYSTVFEFSVGLKSTKNKLSIPEILVSIEFLDVEKHSWTFTADFRFLLASIFESSLEAEKTSFKVT